MIGSKREGGASVPPCKHRETNMIETILTALRSHFAHNIPACAVAAVTMSLAVAPVQAQVFGGAVSFGGSGSGDFSEGLAVDGNGNVYTVGVFIGSEIDFDPGPDTFN